MAVNQVENVIRKLEPPRPRLGGQDHGHLTLATANWSMVAMKSKLVTKRVNMKVAGLWASSLFAVGVLTCLLTKVLENEKSIVTALVGEVAQGGTATAVPGTVT